MAGIRPPHRLTRLALLALIGALAVSTASGIARTGSTKRVAKMVQSTSGDRVLANMRGRTLYSLSAERRGRFICRGGCLSTWPPLLVAKGVKPRGPVRLGRIERPDGRMQVTYRGRPLYTFAEDRRRGETNGQGIKDVGTWRVARKRASEPAPEPVPTQPYPGTPYPPPPPPVESSPSPPPEESPYPYPYGY